MLQGSGITRFATRLKAAILRTISSCLRMKASSPSSKTVTGSLLKVGNSAHSLKEKLEEKRNFQRQSSSSWSVKETPFSTKSDAKNPSMATGGLSLEKSTSDGTQKTAQYAISRKRLILKRAI